MPCLNQDILFDIGKKLIEEGNQEDVFKFAFSGREPFKAMKKVFSSVTSLKLYMTNYEIGWGVKYSKFMLGDGKPHSKFLMHQLGSCVKNLHIYCKIPFLRQMYQPILDKIIAREQLFDFCVGPSCTTSFLDEFFPVFSTSLKHVTIPNNLLTPTFRDTLELESLTILNPNDCNFALFCCKTSSLKFVHFYDSQNNLASPTMLVSLSPALSVVKELTIVNSDELFMFDQFEQVIKYFPSLEAINYKIATNPPPPLCSPKIYNEYIPTNVRGLMKTINRAIKVPPKITCSFFPSDKRMFPRFYFDLPYLDFDYDRDLCPWDNEVHCFQKKLSSADNESILFEIQFFK